jgi:glycosyltransferase involved in cell wall biosynthesis
MADKTRLEYFKDIFRGKRCFIIGNGPSINATDLTKIKDEITFGVNCIFYHFDKMGFKPTFYVVEDTLVAEDRAHEINNLEGTNKILGNYLKYCLKEDKDVIWANVRFEWDYPDFPHFSKDAGKRLWVGGTVSYLCMQLAYYMGFSKVYLIGFDHSYNIPQDTEVSGTVITSNSDDPNHFHPGYFGKGKRWHDPRLDRMEKAYRRAKSAFNEDGREIYNATIDSKLEIFPKRDYDALFLTDNSAGVEEKPCVSVILCTHKNPELLNDVLKDLDNQTFKNDMYEIIAVDNNSQGETKNVISKYPKVKYILEKNIGLSYARNRGLREARGEVVAFTDDDTRIESNWLEELLKVYREHPEAWVVGGKILPIWDAPRPRWLKGHLLRSLSLIYWGEKTRELIWPERNIGANVSFKKKVFNIFGFLNTSLGRKGENSFAGYEEVDMQYCLYLAKRKIFYTPYAAVYHHVPASRMTKEYLRKRDIGHLATKTILRLKTKRFFIFANVLERNFQRLVSVCSSPCIYYAIGILRRLKRFFKIW